MWAGFESLSDGRLGMGWLAPAELAFEETPRTRPESPPPETGDSASVSASAGVSDSDSASVSASVSGIVNASGYGYVNANGYGYVNANANAYVTGQAARPTVFPALFGMEPCGPG